MKQQYGNQINFLMISNEDAEKVIQFKDENNYSFFFAQSQTPFQNLGITSVPMTYFYDAKGKLVASKKDDLSEAELNGCIDKLIKN
jgi:hypothetical protein